MKIARADSNFDCLKFKDEVQAEIYEETKDVTRQQLKDYFKKSAESAPFADLWMRLRNRKEK